MNSKKNVIIISARRSGTHLLTDLIVNNFGYESIKYNYIDYSKFTSEMPIFESLMDEGSFSYKQPYVNHPKVTWTHSHNHQDYLKYKHSDVDNFNLNRFFTGSKVILIYRDIRDIITSCYHRPRTQEKYRSFFDFYDNFDFDGYELIDQNYDNIFELLLQYYKNWFSVYMAKELIDIDMEVISYEEIIKDYDNSLNKIGKFLKQTPAGIDVRLPNKNNENIIYTSNDFRNGKVGDWVDTMDKDFGKYLGEKYQIDLGIGFNYFLNDTQIHKYHKPTRNDFYKKDCNSNLINLEKQLKEYTNKFNFFKEGDVKKLIDNRYKDAIQKSTDFRYYHKVFYYDNYILKFHYPCKAPLDKDIFDKVVPTASKEQLLTIFKTNDFLYESGIVPKLYDAGMYKGILYVIQEKCPKENVICEKYNIYPQAGDWSWVVDLDLKSVMLNHFYKALDNNILLTDMFNVYNCAFDKSGDLKYFDLDGIKYYESKEEMIKSEDYKNTLGIVKEINKFGKSK